MRSRSRLLGIVYPPDKRSAEAAAVAEFKIGEEQRRRLQTMRRVSGQWRDDDCDVLEGGVVVGRIFLVPA
jgi:hypothetical protein